MLDTLKQLDAAAAEDILTHATLSLLPDPGIEGKSGLGGGDPSLADRVLGEVRRRLHLASDDVSSPAKARILDYLTNEMSTYALRNANLNEIRARLGRRGVLPAGEYRIEFTEYFRTRQSSSAVPRSEILETIRYPDYTQHIQPERVFKTQGEAITLLVKASSGGQISDPSLLLVHTLRRDDHLRVWVAWRIFPSEVALQGAQSPVDLLKAFVDKYGVWFQVVGGAPTKLILDDPVLIRPERIPPDMEVLDPVDLPRGSHAEATWMLNPVGLDIVGVFFAYAINLTQYFSDLRKHGVHISTPPPR